MTKNDLQLREAHGPSRKEILARLQAEGVETTEKLVDRLLASRHSHDLKPNNEIGFGSIFASVNARPKGQKPINYQPPKVPLYIDGVSVDPKDISRFDAQPLEFVATKLTDGTLALHASTGTPILDYMKSAYAAAVLTSIAEPDLSRSRMSALTQTPSRLDAGPGPGPYNYGQVQVFSDIEFSGDWTWCAAGQRIPDLRQVNRNCTLWWCDDWNDVISSSAATELWVAYYWDIWFQGSILWQPPLTPFDDFRKFGWNDQVSSIWDLGIPY